MDKPEHAPRKKDFWDKLSAVGPLIAGLIISGIGSWFTYTYNQRQIRLQEVQTVEKFIPHLLGDQESKELAILAISSLGNTRLATELAVRYPSSGTAAALESLSATGDTTAQQLADEAISMLQERGQQLVNNMFAESKQIRIAATMELVRKWASDPRVLELALATANENLQHASGRINTLVLLENVDLQVLGKFASEVEDLLQKFESEGSSQTLQHVQAVRSRLVPLQ